MGFCRACYGRNHKSKAKLKGYGLTEAQHSELSAKFPGVCHICWMPERAKRSGRAKDLAVDHCHGTGLVRGLLCTRCNLALGLLDDDTDTLYRAIEYLEEAYGRR